MTTIPIDEVVIIPFEGMPAPTVQALADELTRRGVRAHIDPPISLPQAAYEPDRRQYRADLLLSLVSGDPDRHLVGITDCDLFVPGLNFVFGMAQVRGNACIVSSARLLDGENGPLLRRRLVKEVVHELGHTLGLEHCRDPRCVMYFSNTLADTDRKGDAYCGHCLSRLDVGRSVPQ